MAESISLKLTGAPIAHPSLPSALRLGAASASTARALMNLFLTVI